MHKRGFPEPPSPYWIASTPPTDYPALQEDLEVDVAIAGGGMVGIVSAYLLSREGLKVALVEADRILQGTTGHTTAKLTSQHDLIYQGLKKRFGEEMARQYAEANESAIHMLGGLAEENKIDCDFVWRPAFIYTLSDAYVKQIEDEAEAAFSLGIAASCVEHIPLPFEVKAALRFDHQAQFHPLKFLKALAEKFVAQEGRIFEQTQAVEIEEGKTCAINTSGGHKIKASQVIIATHYPFWDGGGLYFTRLNPDRSYVVAATIEGRFPPGMYINAEEPARSLRSQRFEDGELVLFGGEHHKTGQCSNTEQLYNNLVEFARQTFTIKDIMYRWSTQDYSTLDGVPYVGHLRPRTPNVFVATGFGKWGMTNSMAAASILKDLITRGDSPWARVYNPARTAPVSSLGKFISINANVAKNYVAGKLKPALDDAKINRNESRVVSVDGKKMGAYRDNQGCLHMVDITCPHVGCELEWNNAEKSWDCPCHGSRFTYEGEIIEGPAQYCLSHIEHEPNPVDPHIYQ